MSNEQGYNGWTNYETWQAVLWLDEDDIAGMLADQDYDDVAEMAQSIQSMVEELYLDLDSLKYGLQKDVLVAWNREVNYTEIAEHYWTDYAASKALQEDDSEED